MLKNEIQKRGLSLYRISKETGIAYSTLNDLACGKVSIENCKAGMLRKLSGMLDMSMDELYDTCFCSQLMYQNAYGIDVVVKVKNKTFFAEFLYNKEPVRIELCKVSEDARFYIEEIATWRSEGYIRERRMQDFA